MTTSGRQGARQRSAALRRLDNALGLLRSTHPADLLRAVPLLGRPRALAGWVRSLKAMHLVRSSPLFDAAFYLKTYPDVAQSGMEPARHYVLIGAAKSYQPSGAFDTGWYLEQNPDVARAGINPLHHYIVHGRRAGRQPLPTAQQTGSRAIEPRFDLAGGIARIEQSNATRLENLIAFREQIAAYQSARCEHDHQRLRVAVYTAAVGAEAPVLQPVQLNPAFDYWCFTDQAQTDLGTWQFARLPFCGASDERAQCYVKTHPHQLLADYDVVIWVDPAIQLHGSLASELERFLESRKPVGAFANAFCRSVYAESQDCIARFPGEASSIQEQLDALRKQGFEHDDLIDPALLCIDLRDGRSDSFLGAWWRLIEHYSACDQLSVNPALREAGLQWDPLAAPDTGLHRFAGVAIGSAEAVTPSVKALEQAMGGAQVDPMTDLPARSSALAGRSAQPSLPPDHTTEILFYVGRYARGLRERLESLAATLPDARVTLTIIDAQPRDEVSLQLQAFCEQRELARVVRADSTDTIVANLNRGLAASFADLVFMLDSQVTVTARWIEKLTQALLGIGGAGLVGPVSNACPGQSVFVVPPAHRHTGLNILPPGATVEQIDRLCESLGTPVVSAVLGDFCVGITREVLNTIGGFDESVFADGHAHDQDYSLRAADAGFACVIATDTFVFQTPSPACESLITDAVRDKAGESLAGLFGHARVARLGQVLDRQSQLLRVRDAIETMDHAARSKLPRVSVFPGIAGSGMPGSSAYIRLVLPLSLPAVTRVADIDLHGYWKRQLPPPGSARICYLQRDVVDLDLSDIQAWSQAWKAAGGQIYFDLDDDLFDTEGLMQRTRKSAEDVGATQARIRSILDCADLVTVSTPELAQRLEPMCRSLLVMPNDLDERLWNLPDHERCRARRDDREIIRIGYIGSATHQQDLEIIVQVVQRIESEFGERVAFEVVGAFEGREVLFGKPLDLQGASDYPAFVDWAVGNIHWDIGLIPLLDDTFNRSKSDLKFTEYAALGMAIVCSDVPSYRSVASDEQNSLVVPNTEQAWYEAIVRLIEDPSLRERLAVAAHDLVCQQRTLQSNEARVVNMLARAC